MIKTFLVIWIIVLMNGSPVSSLRVKMPQDNMDVCQENLQNLTTSFIVDNKEYWDGYDLMVSSSCEPQLEQENETR